MDLLAFSQVFLIDGKRLFVVLGVNQNDIEGNAAAGEYLDWECPNLIKGNISRSKCFFRKIFVTIQIMQEFVAVSTDNNILYSRRRIVVENIVASNACGYP